MPKPVTHWYERVYIRTGARSASAATCATSRTAQSRPLPVDLGASRSTGARAWLARSSQPTPPPTCPPAPTHVAPRDPRITVASCPRDTLRISPTAHRRARGPASTCPPIAPNVCSRHPRAIGSERASGPHWTRHEIALREGAACTACTSFVRGCTDRPAPRPSRTNSTAAVPPPATPGSLTRRDWSHLLPHL